jgi:hypothetical protein
MRGFTYDIEALLGQSYHWIFGGAFGMQFANLRTSYILHIFTVN